MSESIASVRSFLKIRPLVAVYAVLILICVGAMVYFGIRISPSDIQVSMHYTSFGGVNFYTSSWWSAIAFILFFGIVAIGNTAIGVKLLARKGVQTALSFGGFSIGIALFACIMVGHIINVAFPL